MAEALAGDWLEGRLTEVPAELAVAIRELLGDTSPDTAEDLAVAAVRGLERLGVEAEDRASALALLAADALLTYAFEAAADPELGGSAASAVMLAEAYGPTGSIGSLLSEAS